MDHTSLGYGSPAAGIDLPKATARSPCGSEPESEPEPEPEPEPESEPEPEGQM